MDLQAELNEEHERVERIMAVARGSFTPVFCDLYWGDCQLDIVSLERNPAVMFESARRCVVLQYIAGELRYCACGWCLDQDRRYLEEDRIETEGVERGAFAAVRTALAFSAEYLVKERAFPAIIVPRRVFSATWLERGHTRRGGSARMDRLRHRPVE
jgi:hypothetical protein